MNFPAYRQQKDHSVKRAPLMFLIAYAIALGLWYGLAQFITAYKLGEKWATDPFNRRKSDGPNTIEVVYAHIIADTDDDGFRLIPYADHEYHLMGNSQGLWPEDFPGNRGVVTFIHSHGLYRVGPFILRNRSGMGIHVYLEERNSVPQQVLDDARIAAIAHAHASFDMPHFTEDELPFDDGYTPENWIGREGRSEYLIPLWLNISIFVFGPFIAAWTFTAVANWNEPSRSPACP